MAQNDFYDNSGQLQQGQDTPQQNYNGNPATAPGGQPDYGNISSWYKKYLGREGSSDEYNMYMRNGVLDPNSESYVKQSEEAQAYAQKTNARPAGPQVSPSPGNGQPAFSPPAIQQSPFIMPNGMVPPGMPYSPDGNMQSLQNSILQNTLTNPVLSPEGIGRINEQQKELVLQRGGQAQRAYNQNAAQRGILGGGNYLGSSRRIGDATTQDLLKSQRDVAIGAETTNRQGFLDALGASDNILGGREDRGLNVSKFSEAIRQYQQDLAERQAEFGSNLDFQYNNLNANLQQQFINALMSAGR